MSSLPQDDAVAMVQSDYIVDPGPPAPPLRLPPVKEVLSSYTLLTRIFSNIIPLDDRDANRAVIVAGRKRLLAIARNIADIQADQLGPSFFKYAERVQTLEISERMAIVRKDAPIDPNIYLLLSQQLGGTPLLPRLESIVLSLPTSPSSTTLPLPVLLPCSSLHAVEVQGPILETKWCHKVFLPALASRASSSLKRLGLKHDKTQIRLVGLWDTLLKLSGLEALSLCLPQSPDSDLPSGSLWLLLTRLTRLSSLSLNLEINHTDSALGRLTELPSSGPLGTSQYVSSLQHLSLLENVGSWLGGCHASRLLVPVVVRSLASVTLTSNQSDPWERLAYVGDALRECTDLRRVILQSTEPGTNISTFAILEFLERVQPDEFVVNIDKLDNRAGSAFFGRLLDRLGVGAVQSGKPVADSPQRLVHSLLLPPSWTGHQLNLKSLTQISQKAPTLRRIGIPIASNLHPTTLQHITELVSSGPLGPESSNLLHLELCDTRDPESSGRISPHQYQIIAQYIDKLFPRASASHTQGDEIVVIQARS
ncbi:hypothetical protein EST38_g13898 [Candolleomyces aberdarensis]|uniref:Uncharacterized protein n=1 Tax=Candolleomyces aberdarensis TaxID=2316362 RepID=A0A4Q2CZN0_9AGAR|nr:hypothetical protein EST38_g13898 [Candolleomyces aberdarensis]